MPSIRSTKVIASPPTPQRKQKKESVADTHVEVRSATIGVKRATPDRGASARAEVDAVARDDIEDRSPSLQFGGVDATDRRHQRPGRRSSSGPCQQFGRETAQEAGRGSRLDAFATSALTAAGEVEALARPGDGHIGDAELLVESGPVDWLDPISDIPAVARAWGMSPSLTPTTKTTDHSPPLARWIVVSRTRSTSSAGRRRLLPELEFDQPVGKAAIRAFGKPTQVGQSPQA